MEHATKPCPVASTRMVGAAFGARAVNGQTRTSPLGQPLCTFAFATSNVGGAGTVIVSVDSAATRAAFETGRRSAPGATRVKLGDDAYYVNNTGTIHLRKGRTAVVAQATFRLRAGTRYATRIERDVKAFAAALAAQL